MDRLPLKSRYPPRAAAWQGRAGQGSRGWESTVCHLHPVDITREEIHRRARERERESKTETETETEREREKEQTHRKAQQGTADAASRGRTSTHPPGRRYVPDPPSFRDRARRDLGEVYRAHYTSAVGPVQSSPVKRSYDG